MSENDLEILVEQSDTADVAGNTNSTDAASGGTGCKRAFIQSQKSPLTGPQYRAVTATPPL